MLQTIEKLPPHNIEAEEAVLGAILLERDAIIALAGALKPGDFFRASHGDIYAAALALYERREPPDMLTIASELERHGHLEECGGYGKLAELMSATPTSVHAEFYARQVTETATLRRLIQAGTQIVNLGYNAALAPQEALGTAQAMLQAVAEERQADGGFVSLGDALAAYSERLETLQRTATSQALVGVTSGLCDLDAMTGGFQNSDLVVLAARPGAGKTAMLLGMAAAAAKQGKTVGVFSLEMPIEQLVHRFLAMETGIDASRLRLGQIGDDEWESLSRAMGVLAELQIYIDDRSGLTITEVRSRALGLKAQRGVDLVVVDYLQLMRGTGRHRDANRVQEVGEVSRGLKGLARELAVPVLSAAQLSRAVESRSSHIPMLSDLRESGSVEQDADMVMFIYRADLYAQDEAAKGAAELHVAKHRNGPLGVVNLRFFERTTKFADLDTRYSDSWRP